MRKRIKAREGGCNNTNNHRNIMGVQVFGLPEDSFQSNEINNILVLCFLLEY